MEAKAIVKKYNNYKQPGGSGLSPERAKVWTEKSPKYHQKIRNQQQNNNNGGKVAVVYYLCRNRQLEHPHFIEVPLSSPDGHLYLRDVIERLNVLRGRGMASMYSWSCKRSYKNGFVWHDLCEDDVILPAHGNEYVLKGSELFEDSSPGPFSPNANIRMPKLKSLPEPPASRCQDDTSSSSSLNDRTTKNSQEEELSPTIQYRGGSSSVSPESSEGKNSSSICNMMSLTEYKVYKSEGQTDAATQTDENGSSRTRETCTRGVSTDDVSSEHESNPTRENQLSKVKDNSEISQVSVSSPPPTSSSATSSGARTDTLESLIRADASKFNNFRILEEEEFRPSSMSKFKASNMLLQLFSCGSFSVKDRSFNLIPTYKPSFTSSRFPSPFFSSSFLLGEIDSMSENPRHMGVRLEDKEYFSGSLVETSILKDEGIRTLKRSSSYNADRCRTKKQNEIEEEDDEDRNTTNSKCIPRSIKVSLIKQQPKSESQRSVSDGPRVSSSDGVETSRITTSCAPNGGSKRYANSSESPKDEKENVIKIEERLASGARVIIQSEAFPDDDRKSSVISH